MSHEKGEQQVCTSTTYIPHTRAFLSRKLKELMRDILNKHFLKQVNGHNIRVNIIIDLMNERVVDDVIITLCR